MAAGHENGADAPGSQRLATAAAGCRRLDVIGVIAEVQAAWRDGCSKIESRLSSVTAAGREPLHLRDQYPVDCFQLGAKRPLRVLVEPAPEGQQMLLPNALESGDKIG
jgi:hypothetical protein